MSSSPKRHKGVSASPIWGSVTCILARVARCFTRRTVLPVLEEADLSRQPKRVQCFVIALAAGVFLLAHPGSAAHAAFLGIQIVAQLNTGSGFVTQGTAFGAPAGGSTPLVVFTPPGDTLRFIVQYDQVATYTQYLTNVLTDDPSEIDYLLGSGVDLSGNGFGPLGAPDQQLNDASPHFGVISSRPTAMVTGQALYRLEYIVQAGVNFDFLKDFTVTLNGAGSGNTINPAMNEASVVVSLQVPEPSALLLLAPGLALLARAGWGRRWG